MEKLSWLIAGLTVLLLIALTMEKVQALRYRRALRHIIHVNGTRGKSSVVRLLDAALREQGFRVLSKSTGTLPMILHVDGRETELKRYAPANIREQLGLMRLAVQEGAEILVIECMAVDPRLQYTSQHKILQADIGVITNARLDHQDVMGETREEVLEALLNTVPKNGILYTAESDFFPRIEEKAAALHSRAVLAQSAGSAEEAALDFPENVALAAAVAGDLGVSYAGALQNMQRVRRDPYAMEVLQQGKLCFVNAMSTNDVRSAQMVLHSARSRGAAGKLMVLINNRADRPARAREMVRLCRALTPEKIFLVGEQTFALSLLCRRALPQTPVLRPKTWKDLPLQPEEETLLFAVGNIKGAGMKLLDLLRRKGEDHV